MRFPALMLQQYPQGLANGVRLRRVELPFVSALKTAQRMSRIAIALAENILREFVVLDKHAVIVAPAQN